MMAAVFEPAPAREPEAGAGAPWVEHIQLVLDETKPLERDIGERLPLYLWPAMDPGPLTDQRAEELVQLLADRGVGLVCSWRHEDIGRNLAECLPVARAQKKLGLLVNINATTPMYSFFDGSAETAHIDGDGKTFFDDTFGKQSMGCPFRLEHRISPMRERIEAFTEAYAKEGIPLGFVFADWEIDGPLEWNRAHEASRRCVVCQEQLPQLDDFLAYQNRLRQIRSRLQREVFSEPVLRHSPNVLVGNYAVYPHDGWRYWYDYFERYVDGQPALQDQLARYRHWANDFESTGYTFAMPVVYPWSWTWNWYDFQPGDYRLFYNGLLVASNAGRHTPASVPIIAFVHWHTVDVGKSCRDGDKGEALPDAEQMSAETYQELLWHMLLRGTDTFFLWCQQQEQAREVRLLHPVWAAAQEYGEFLSHGTPITYHVPGKPGPVVSGLRLGDQVLVRRTDFTDMAADVVVRVGHQDLAVPRCPGRCQILQLR
jgi:hypothetical protein